MLLLLGYAIHRDTEFPSCHRHIQQYVVPEQLFSRIAELGLGTELLFGCGVLSALRIYIFVSAW